MAFEQPKPSVDRFVAEQMDETVCLVLYSAGCQVLTDLVLSVFCRVGVRYVVSKQKPIVFKIGVCQKLSKVYLVDYGVHRLLYLLRVATNST